MLGFQPVSSSPLAAYAVTGLLVNPTHTFLTTAEILLVEIDLSDGQVTSISQSDSVVVTVTIQDS